jgi:hypothetical protein
MVFRSNTFSVLARHVKNPSDQVLEIRFRLDNEAHAVACLHQEVGCRSAPKLRPKRVIARVLSGKEAHVLNFAMTLDDDEVGGLNRWVERCPNVFFDIAASYLGS